MQGRLTVTHGEAIPPEIPLSPDHPISIGRSRDSSVVVPRDEHASRLHARIYFGSGRWYLENYGMNGTRVNNERIERTIPLETGAEIRIGDVRFRLDLPTPLGSGSYVPVTADRLPTSEHVTLSTTRMDMDELSTLCQFMGNAVEQRDPQELVRQGLTVILEQTGASLAGYLSLDPTDPLPRLVLPDPTKVDPHLSRQLTRRVQRDGRMVWLSGEGTPPRTMPESIIPFHDAICLPLKAAGESLGALHVYKANANFTERNARFCEALGGYLAHHLCVLKEQRKLLAENTRLRSHLAGSDELLGDSLVMAQLRQRIARAANQSFTVLIQGESGSGKELVALALHKRSPRHGGPFVVVNCAAIPASLMEAELFGYRRGSFTGADRDHAGVFQQADEGTLFLDEVAELSPECQAKLLRVIEGRAFRLLGATTDTKTDVRIIAATHRNLEHEVKAGRFREDLYFRLKVIEIPVPPLRERTDDIPYLVQFFLDKLAIECHRTLHISPEAIRVLQRYPWPGNVRQLRAFLESAVAMSRVVAK